MRVLLTGATGFIGSYVTRHLVETGEHHVAVLLRPGTDTWRIADILDKLHPVQHDFRDLANAEYEIKAFSPEVVIHLAWWGVGNRQRNDVGQVDNVDPCLKLVRLAKTAGARAWIGLGSQAEYGPSEGALSEDAPTRPTTLYGTAKLCCSMMAERICRETGMRFAWLRVFSTYGPRDDPQWLIPYLIMKLHHREKPALTLGTQFWDYLHVGDAARAIKAVALSETASGTFNLGSGQAHTVRSIVETIRDTIDPSLPLGFGEIPFRPDQVMYLQANIARLNVTVGWFPAIDLKSGLQQTVTWYKAHAANGG